jgi:hypothetical protein
MEANNTEIKMAYQIKVYMPQANDMGRRTAVVRAIEGKTSKPFQIMFVETDVFHAFGIHVECHNKGVGAVTLEKWTRAARVSLTPGRARDLNRGR